MAPQSIAAKKNIWLVTLYSLGSSELENRYIKEALSMKVQGILLVPLDIENYSRYVIDLSVKNIPFIFVEHQLMGLGVPCISSNHYNIMYTATKYLCERGHCNVMLVMASTHISSIFDRLSGYEEALQRFNGSCRKYIFTPNYSNSINLNIEYRNYITSNNITAAICPSGDMALRFAFCMKNLNKTIGTDYELVLIDEESYYLESMLGTKVPTVIQDGRQIGIK